MARAVGLVAGKSWRGAGIWELARACCDGAATLSDFPMGSARTDKGGCLWGFWWQLPWRSRRKAFRAGSGAGANAQALLRTAWRSLARLHVPNSASFTGLAALWHGWAAARLGGLRNDEENSEQPANRSVRWPWPYLLASSALTPAICSFVPARPAVPAERNASCPQSPRLQVSGPRPAAEGRPFEAQHRPPSSLIPLPKSLPHEFCATTQRPPSPTLLSRHYQKRAHTQTALLPASRRPLTGQSSRAPSTSAAPRCCQPRCCCSHAPVALSVAPRCASWRLVPLHHTSNSTAEGYDGRIWAIAPRPWATVA